MKRKKNLIKGTIIAFILGGFMIAFFSLAHKQQHDTVCFGKSCIEVELATTQKEITTGLMNRKNLPESAGMLFIFESEGIHMFWMKDTLIPLDIIWMDPQGTVIYIEKDAQPCKALSCPTFGPRKNSKYVLEVNSGYAQKHSINVEDNAEIMGR